MSDQYEKLMDKSVYDFEWTVRTANLLNNASIQTIRDIFQHSEKDFLAYRGCGKVTICEIKSKLEELGLSLKGAYKSTAKIKDENKLLKTMPINSRAKGARGERLWRDELRAQGFTARRGQQFSGSPDSPDVICEELKALHQEVKFVQSLNLDKACEQAERDSRGKRWIVAHKKNNKAWKVTMSSDTFFAILRDGMEGIKI